MRRLVRAAFRRHIVWNATQVSLVVGTILNLINQGGALLDGGPVSLGHLALNYLIPYGVASFSAARNEFHRCPSDEK